MNPFTIKPQKAYTSPRYPDHNRVGRAAKILMTAGIGILATSCAPPLPWHENNNNNNNIIDGVAVECFPGDLQCANENEILVCSSDEGYEHWEAMDCNDWCHENYGWDYSSWGACSEDNGDNLCQCEYDIIDGGIGYCDTDDFYCGDENTINVCNDSQTDYQNLTCDEYCAIEWGSDMFMSSGTCDDAQPEDPCNCFYGMMDGMIAECTLEDVQCISDKAMGVCENGVDFTWYKCDDVCKDQDPNAVSNGCDAAVADDPCLCEIAKKK
ncbi:hypothetical protein KKF84_08540 [Myxococcota bacterium]|nr:hypothetical protein [Myxococcota bacterium]